ncbi:hypothetical protein FACS1894170_03900 [Planctomycetales bacterium]|nr:hypothetical protein FACS1894170_03900 [Planctomycetales bacterium]
MFRVVCYPIFGSYVFVVLLVVALAAVIWRSQIHSSQLPPYGSRWLFLLRVFAFAVLIFGFLRPTVVYTKTERLAATVNILLDQSESMSRPDEIGGKTRYQVAKEALVNAAGQLAALQQQAEVKFFTFDADIQPLTMKNGQVQDLPENPAGIETALGYTLDQIRNTSAGKRVRNHSFKRRSAAVPSNP